MQAGDYGIVDLVGRMFIAELRLSLSLRWFYLCSRYSQRSSLSPLAGCFVPRVRYLLSRLRIHLTTERCGGGLLGIIRAAEAEQSREPCWHLAAAAKLQQPASFIHSSGTSVLSPLLLLLLPRNLLLRFFGCDALSSSSSISFSVQRKRCTIIINYICTSTFGYFDYCYKAHNTTAAII